LVVTNAPKSSERYKERSLRVLEREKEKKENERI